MRRFEAANFPTGVDEAVHDIGFELVLGLEEIVVEAGEELEGFLAFRFEDDPVRKAAMRSAIEGGAGPAFGGDSPATFATIYA